MAKSENEVRTELRGAIRRFAIGCNDTQADEVLDVIVQGWGFRDCAQLAGVLPLLTVPGLGPNGALFFLHAFLLIANQSTAARRMILKAASTLAHVEAADAASSN